MPYRVNEATRCLFPPQALEYLAAEKPVVSTALPDVASLLGGAVRIARDAGEFIAACEAALTERPEVRAARLARSADCVTRYSWDEAARTAQRLLDEALERSASDRVSSPLDMPAAPAAAGNAGTARGRGLKARPPREAAWTLLVRPGAGVARRPAASSSGGTW